MLRRRLAQARHLLQWPVRALCGHRTADQRPAVARFRSARQAGCSRQWGRRRPQMNYHFISTSSSRDSIGEQQPGCLELAPFPPSLTDDCDCVSCAQCRCRRQRHRRRRLRRFRRRQRHHRRRRRRRRCRRRRHCRRCCHCRRVLAAALDNAPRLRPLRPLQPQCTDVVATVAVAVAVAFFVSPVPNSTADRRVFRSFRTCLWLRGCTCL